MRGSREELPFRLPATLRLGRVRLQVSDLARSVEYYEKVLGFRVASLAPQRAVLTAHGDERPIVELRERLGARPVPRRGRLGLYHFAILLPDRVSLGRFLRHLRDSGVRAGMSDHVVSEAIYLTDLDGLGIEVYADRPRSTWREDRGELYMTTTPLDVHSMLEAAGDEPWTGMPVAAAIGHVHLFVDDLDQAEKFYHSALGLDKTVWSYPGALFFSAGGYHHHLGTNVWAAGAPRSEADDARLLDWEIILPDTHDADEAAASIESAGYAVSRIDNAWAAVDPWGTTLRVKGEHE